VLGDQRYAATRINLAQSCNGVGWICGPIIGSVYFYSKDAAGHSTGSQTLYIPYAAIAGGHRARRRLLLRRIPDIKTGDDYHLDDSAPGVSHSIWSHPHFVMAVAAQFFYVAAQAGIFSFFINYMTAEVPAIPASWQTALGASRPMPASCTTGCRLVRDQQGGVLASATRARPTWRPSGFVCFLVGRFSGAGLLRKFAAHKMLGLYGVMNVAATCWSFCKLGWLSVACVFLSYFFMSIMFPTIFALGIFGLGARAKKASAFIVMAIMGGAILPKLMGHVADKYDMSRGFIVPMFCFAFVAFYGFNWPSADTASACSRAPARSMSS
jgi:MFS transporter, FHS family, L-fucose permease